MALTPEQIQSIRERTGIKKTVGSMNRSQELADAFGIEVPTEEVFEPNTFAFRAGEQIKKGGEEVFKKITGEGEEKEKSDIRRGTEAFAKAASVPLKIGFEALPEVTRKGLEDLGEKLGDKFKFLTDKIAGTKLFKELGELEAQGFITKENAPELFNVRESLGTTEALGQIAGEVLLAEGIVTGAQKVVTKGRQVVGKISEEAPKLIKEGISKVKEIRSPAKLAQDLTKIEETISPGLTSKEIQKIASEGRLTRGKQSRLFGDKPDIITQSKGVKKASETINERIPNASKMNDQELLKATQGEISNIATKLKPEMQKIQVTADKTTEALNTWNRLKTSQVADADFVAFGGKTMQKNFEAFLNEVKTRVKGVDGKFRNKNLDDMWEIRKRYDNSIPDRVKQAHSGSESRLQFQKDTWLQNRAILNNMINDTASGMGDVSRKAFSEMTDLYTARQNIITKTKLSKEAIGLLSGENLKRVTVKLGLIWIGGNLIERVTGVDIPGI